MTTNKETVHQTIDDMGKTAKAKMDQVIDDVMEVAGIAAEKAGRHVHDAGESVKGAGEKIMKLVD